MLDLYCRFGNLAETLLACAYLENPSLQCNTNILNIRWEIDIPSEWTDSPLPNKQMNTSGTCHSLLFFHLGVLGDAVVWPLDLSCQDEGAVASPGDGDLVGFLDAWDFYFDKVFLDGVAEVEVGLVGVVFWSGIAASEVLHERLVLMVTFVRVIDKRRRVVVVLQRC